MGQSVEPEAFSAGEARLIASAARAAAADKEYPGGKPVVLQRLMRLHREGKHTVEEVADAADYLHDACDDADGISVEDVVGELAPILRRRAENRAVKQAVEAYAKRQDLTEVVRNLQAAERIGRSETPLGTRVGSGSFDVIESIRGLTRLPTGISELDPEIGGGLARDTLTVAMGATGSGKSIFLSHLAGTAMLAGLHVAIATLELPRAYWIARLKANLTGVSTDEILDGSGTEACRERICELEARPSFGIATVADFTPYVTTFGEVAEWAKAEEQRSGRKVDLLVTDYADKLGHTEDGEYLGMRAVYEAHRTWALDKHAWAATASASKRKEKSRRADIEDAADSIHKGRSADLWLSLSTSEDNASVEILVSKNRLGKGRSLIGPLPTEFEYGRLCPMAVLAADGEDWLAPV